MGRLYVTLSPFSAWSIIWRREITNYVNSRILDYLASRNHKLCEFAVLGYLASRYHKLCEFSYLVLFGFEKSQIMWILVSCVIWLREITNYVNYRILCYLASRNHKLCAHYYLWKVIDWFGQFLWGHPRRNKLDSCYAY